MYQCTVADVIVVETVCIRVLVRYLLQLHRRPVAVLLTATSCASQPSRCGVLFAGWQARDTTGSISL